MASDPLAEFGHAIAANGEGVIAVGSPACSPATLQYRVGRVDLLPVANLSGLALSLETVSTATIHGSEEFGRLGLNLRYADVNRDAHLDLLVGAPLSNGGMQHERGTLYVWLKPPTGVVDAKDSCDAQLVGTRAGGRFGSSIAVMAVGELVVASPRASENGIQFSGAIDTHNLSF